MANSRRMLTSLDPQIELDQSQKDAIEKLSGEAGGLCWMNVGDGKTRVALTVANEVLNNDGYYIIVCVARRAAFYDWTTEVATLQLPFGVIEAEHVQQEHVFNSRVMVLVSEGKLLTPATIDLLRAIEDQIGCFIVDEGWLYKNPQSQKHLALRQFTQNHPTIVLSGSVMTAQDLVDIYGQVAISGRQKVFGTLTKFRQTYQTGIAAAGPGSWARWVPKPGAYKAIMEKIAPFTYLNISDIKRVKTTVQIIKTQMTDKQRDYLKELKETAAIEGKFELTNMGNIITKAQQISNGWLEDDKGGVEYFESGKVDRLCLLVDELLQTTYKMVIWCAFRKDIERLKDEFERRDVKSKIATLQGGEPFDVDLWGWVRCRICLATEASGSSVNHFAQVPYAIYFSQDFKWHSLQQSSGRHTRRSSEHRTAYNIFLHSDKTLDSKVYYTVRASQHSEKSFIRQMDVMQWIKEG